MSRLTSRFFGRLVLISITLPVMLFAITITAFHSNTRTAYAASSQWVYLGNDGSSTVQIDNVGSGTFNPNKLSNWHSDATDPLLSASPSSTPNPNIYAAQTQWDATNNRWDVFYGGWDGNAGGHDHVDMTMTTDWTSFTTHQVIVSPGSYTHANNPSVIQNDPTSGTPWRMVYTNAYDNGENRPHYSTSTDGVTWTPNTTSSSNAVSIAGYPSSGDINGGNVLLYANGTYYLYFADFNASGGACASFSGTCLATGTDGINYSYQRVAQTESSRVVNDLKSFSYNGTNYYLMGFHNNETQLYETVSTSLTSFPTSTAFFTRSGYHMVSLGWITKNNRLYGALYGGTTCGCLSTNAISAVWLQDQVNFTSTDQSVHLTSDTARGPDTVLLSLNGNTSLTGSFSLYDTDGTTLLSTSQQVTIKPGDHWQYNVAGPTAIASTQHANPYLPASNVLDGNASIFWSSYQDGSANSEEWIGVNLGTASAITGLSVTPRFANGQALAFPTAFSIQTSNDGSTWTTVPGQSYSNYASPTQPLQFTFSSAVTAQYVRIDATQLGKDDYSNYYFQVAEIATETSRSAASASSQAFSSLGPGNAIDGNASSFWSSAFHSTSNATESLTIDLGSSQSVTGVLLLPRTIGATVYGFPTAFSIQSSTDGSTWTTIPGQSYTGVATPPTSGVTYNFGASVLLRYVRIVATNLGKDDFGNYYFQLAELYPLSS